MLIAHLSDLHLRDAAGVLALDRQLDRITARAPDHLAITGDVLDRWDPALLSRVLDALAAGGWLDANRLTLLHGNHDLASSGGHPRRHADVWRLAVRFWDPPPLVAARRRRFYEIIGRRAPGAAGVTPKTLSSGARIVVIDSVALLWRPVGLERRTLVVRHATGFLRAAQLDGLAALPHSSQPTIVLLHHYPLETPPFQWEPPVRWRSLLRSVRVPMQIRQPDRARFWTCAAAAGVDLVLCGHVHRARLEHHQGIAVGLNGQSGADWAGRKIAWYDVTAAGVRMELEAT